MPSWEWIPYHPAWIVGWFPLLLYLSSHSGLTFSSKCQPVGFDNDRWQNGKNWWSQYLFQCLVGKSELQRKGWPLSPHPSLCSFGVIGGRSSCVLFESHLLVFEVFSVSLTTGGSCHRRGLKRCPVVSRVYHLGTVITLYTQMLLPESLQRALARKLLRDDRAQISHVLWVWEETASYLNEIEGHSFGFNTIPSGQIRVSWKEHEVKSQGWVLGPTLQLIGQPKGNYSCSLQLHFPYKSKGQDYTTFSPKMRSDLRCYVE